MKNLASLILLSVLLIGKIFAQTNENQASKAEMTVQLGHFGTIDAVAFSPDCKYAISGSWDDCIKLWDVAMGREIKTIPDQGIRVKTLAFSHNGKYFLNGNGSTNAINLWDFAEGKIIKTFRGHKDEVNKAIFSPDDKYIISCGGSQDKTIKIWDVTSGELVRTYSGHSMGINSIDISPDGKYLMSASSDKLLILWDFNTGEQVKTFTGHTGFPLTLDISNDGKFVISAGQDNQIVQWDINTGNIIKKFKGHRLSAYVVRISPDDKYLFSGGDDKLMNMWEIASGILVHSFTGSGGNIYDIDITSDGKFAISGDYFNVLNLHNIPEKKLHASLTGFGSKISNLEFSPNGKYFSASNNESVKIWETSSGRLLQSSEGHDFYVRFARFSPDSKYYISGGQTKNLSVREPETGKLITSLKLPMGNDTDVSTFSPDGKKFATSDNRHITIWDTQTWNVLKSFAKHKDAILNLSFSPDGTQIVSACQDDTLRIWDVNTFELASKFTTRKYPKGVEFLSNEKLIYLGSNEKVIKILDAFTGETIKTLSADNNIATFSISPSKTKIVAMSSQSLLIWDVESGTLQKTIKGLQGFTPAVQFSPDEKYIYTAGADTQVKKWEINSGNLVVSHLGLQGINADFVTFTPDNYFTSTKKGNEAVHYVSGKKIFLFDQFDLQYNRPDIIMERQGNHPEVVLPYKKAYEKRLKKMGFTEAMFNNDFHLPEVKLINPNIAITTQQKIIKLNIEAKDSKYNLDRINLYVNDVPVYGTKGISIRDKKIASLAQELTVELSSGKNKIVVSVINEKGVESLQEIIETTYNGPLIEETLYVVSIGISDYNNNDFDLRYAAKDASDLATLLEGNPKKVFKQVKVLKILDKEANKENILKAKDFLNQSKVDDQVILFVAGHGLLDDSLNYFIATADIDFAKPSKRGLAYEQLEGLLDGIPARKKLMLIDACHSGEVDKDEVELIAANNTTQAHIKSRGFKSVQNKSTTLQSSFDLMQALFSDLRKGTGAVVISSASGVEFALESDEWQNGVFTYALLEGMKTNNADKNRDYKVNVTELKDYVINKVGLLTNGKQHPTSRKENLEFDFRVW